MISIEKSKIKDVESIYEIHRCFLSGITKPEERSFIDARTIGELEEIVNEGYSYVIRYAGDIVGYSLFVKYRDGLIGKGVILGKEARGLGLQRMIYKMVKRDHKLYIISSTYNVKSIKNIVGVGLYPIEQINQTDFLYGER